MALSMKGIDKSFGANKVLKQVDFSVGDGEVHALIGENGAGKTTLMNILGGVLRPDAGEIRFDGEVKKFLVPKDSLNAGIAFIHQELNLVNDLNVYENLFLGREIRKKGLIDRKAMIARSKEVLARLNVDLNPETPLRTLDASYKQIVEIARALLFDAHLIIMDEPTTSLTDVEIRRVFDMMRTVKQTGVSIVFISHKLGEVLEICDKFTVLRDGVVAQQGAIAGVTERDLARWMVGHDVRTEKLARNAVVGAELLKVEHLSRERAFEDVSFTLRSGEILGFTGLLGDGRSELFQTLFGVTPECTGTVTLGGKAYKPKSTTYAQKAGLGYVPRNRKENGILPDLSIYENGSIATYSEFNHAGWLNKKVLRGNFEQWRKELSIKMGHSEDLITSLSGGNQQKVVLAKWLSAKPKIMIFDNPTQGVDVGAKEDIYDIVLKLAENGVAVVILSSEAQEIIRLCDRAIVMYHGTVRGELSGENLNDHNVMLLATGGTL